MSKQPRKDKRSEVIKLRPIDQVPGENLRQDMERVKDHVKRLYEARDISPQKLDRTVNI